MYVVVQKPKFKKKYEKLITKNKKYINRIDKTVENLSNKTFTTAMKPHLLDGEYKGYYDVHADYDLVILYTYDEQKKQLVLHDMGTHREFGMHESKDDLTKEELQELLQMV